MKNDSAKFLKQGQIAHDICTEKSVPEAFAKWLFYKEEIPGWKFVFSTEGIGPTGIPTSRDFPKGGFLRSMYAGNHLVFFDDTTMEEMLSLGGSNIPVDYSIMFETNAASYIESKQNGSDKEVIETFTSILDEIIEYDFNYDYILYQIENSHNLSTENASKRIYDKLVALEIFRYLDKDHYIKTGEMKPVVPMSKIIKEATEKISQMLYIIDHATCESGVLGENYQYFYAIFLKAAIIQLSYGKSDLCQKIEDILSFMHNEINGMFLRELLTVYHFFQKGTELSFFGKIQKNNHNILKALKNMVWDVSAFRTLEQMSTITTEGGRYFVPLILTFDRRMIEIYDLYPVYSCAFWENKKLPIPFPKYSVPEILGQHFDTSEVITDRYFTDIAAAQREHQRQYSQVNLTNLVTKLENELTSIN